MDDHMIKIENVTCNQVKHNNEFVKTLCLNPECPENSCTLCSICIIRNHLGCRSQVFELKKEIPQQLIELQQLQKDIVVLQESINQDFLKLLARIEEILLPISKYQDSSNFTNLNEIGLLLRKEPKQNILHTIDETKIQISKRQIISEQQVQFQESNNQIFQQHQQQPQIQKQQNQNQQQKINNIDRLESNNSNQNQQQKENNNSNEQTNKQEMKSSNQHQEQNEDKDYNQTKPVMTQQQSEQSIDKQLQTSIMKQTYYVFQDLENFLGILAETTEVLKFFERQPKHDMVYDAQNRLITKINNSMTNQFDQKPQGSQIQSKRIFFRYQKVYSICGQNQKFCLRLCRNKFVRRQQTWQNIVLSIHNSAKNSERDIWNKLSGFNNRSGKNIVIPTKEYFLSKLQIRQCNIRQKLKQNFNEEYQFIGQQGQSNQSNSYKGQGQNNQFNLQQKVQQKSNLRVELKLSCPPSCPCGSQVVRNWIHKSCGTQYYIIDNQGVISCQMGCGELFVENFDFKCEKSSTNDKFENASQFLMEFIRSQQQIGEDFSDNELMNFVSTLNLNILKRWTQ